MSGGTGDKPAASSFVPATRAAGLRYREVIRASLDGFLLTDAEGQILDANPAYCALVGYSLEELRGMRYPALDVKLSEREYTDGLRRVLQQGRERVQTVHQRRDGDTVDVELSVTSVRAEDEKFWVAFVRDVTEQNRTTQRLQRSAALLEQVQLLANLGIWEWSVADNSVHWSPQLCRIYGVDQDGGAASFEAYLSRVHPDDREAVRRAVQRALETRSSFHFDERIQRPDGELRYLRSWGQVVVDEDGAPQRMYGVCLDVTQAAHAQQLLESANEALEARVRLRTRELAAAKERAESADRLKSAFLATMSHELRTPLNSIIGFAGILAGGLAGPINEEQTRQLGMVRESSEHLLALINDVLDLSKIEAGQLVLNVETFDLGERVRHVVEAQRPVAQKKDIALTVEVDAGVPRVESDRRRVEQILQNLLSNAIKFTDRGSVHVACSRDGDEVQIAVTDTGPGVRTQDIPLLFRPFQQLDDRLSRRHEGTGLGLSISDKLAKLLDGRIDVSSQVGEGSIFRLALPLRHARPKAAETAESTEST